MKHVEAIIFDWAGTTVDYGCMAPIYAMKEAFQQKNIFVTLNEIRQPMGMLKVDHIKALLNMKRVQNSFKEIYERSSTHDDIQEINAIFEKNIFSILHDHATLINGMLTVQDYLHHHQINIGSTSGYTKKMLDIVADGAAKQGYFPDFMIASDQVKQGRPYPYMLHQNLAALDIKDTRNVIKVGDTIIDILEGYCMQGAGLWASFKGVACWD